MNFVQNINLILIHLFIYHSNIQIKCLKIKIKAIFKKTEKKDGWGKVWAVRGRVREEAWNFVFLVSLVKGYVPTDFSLRQIAIHV